MGFAMLNPSYRLFRNHERVPLASGAELDAALGVEIGERDRLRLGADDGVVETRAAALYEAARLAVRRGQPGPHEQFEGGNAACQRIARQRDPQQVVPGPARLEDLARGLRR